MSIIILGRRLARPVERPLEFEIDPSHPLAKDLRFAGLGRMQNSGTYYDSSLYCNHGALTNMDPATDWVPALGRWVLDFDGSASANCVDLPIGILPNASQFWVSLWLYSRDGTTDKRSALSDNSTMGFPTFRNGSFTNKMQFYCGTGAASICNGASTASDASQYVWEHISFGYNGADLLLYRNGKLTDTLAATDGLSLGATATRVRLGGQSYTGTFTSWNGLLADVIIHNRILIPDEIKILADPSNVMLIVGGNPLLRYRPSRSILYFYTSTPVLATYGSWIISASNNRQTTINSGILKGIRKK